MQKHVSQAHGENSEQSYSKCIKCQSNFNTKDELKAHVTQVHPDLGYSCEKCDRNFELEAELKLHIVTVHVERVFNCQRCNKPYTSMTLLRRHDWRSHRAIECNMCGEHIRCRQEIKNHRASRHQMYQKVFCKYFPSCLDGDECLFEHGKDTNESQLDEGAFCENGENCNDQSCKYNEQSHTRGRVLCTFQMNCNRLNCPFKHINARRAFLGEGFINNLRN